ncbi:2-oxoglutarate-dependent dioxygenase AOP3-like [Punica granatum]|uniref:Fe2OG dioxygenase domain-containing protein n=2 Tax=Punica granatum TaxID=22663 RepID=A0A218XBH3_PUNGR|nr:2-oxoglutarate-dependent dioxygenase AOP3-like [Punica granatum]OWM82297.1 hypothetical protein CDL15_Pgr001871 [Punica granatum]PKI62059.1 hypothetical protein CRG98_017432 [Punica granatum]
MGSFGPPVNLPHFHFSEDTLRPGTASWSSTCNVVRRALEDYGFFLVTYDKITPDMHDSTFNAVQELFDGVPTDTKMKNTYEKPLNGYVGQIPKLPLHESLGIDDATSFEGTQRFTDTMWPGTGNNSFCHTIHSYAKLAGNLDQIASRMIFESYGVEQHYDSYIKSTAYLLRLIKNRAPKGDEPNLGFINHTDKSFTTVLHQNGHVNGLEVEMKNGEWIKVEMSSSIFVVMAGDALMAWSNDRIQSPNHKVTIIGDQDRYTLAQFSFNNGVIQVPDQLVDDEHPLKYKPFDHLGLLRYYRTDEGYKSKCPIKSYCGIY